METIEFGTIPQLYKWEADQYHRVKNKILSGLKTSEKWCILVYDAPFHHDAGTEIENDYDWDGQIDLVVLTQSKIVIYELKAFTIILHKGSSNHELWHVQRQRGKKIEKHRSYFEQVSKQKAHLLDDIIRIDTFQAKYNYNKQNHYLIDARLVFKDNSDLSGFYYDVPKTMKPEKFDKEILSKITSDKDVCFVKNCYCNIEAKYGNRLIRNLSKADNRKLREIFLQYGIEIRTAKFFNLIRENEIVHDLSNTGSDRFTLSLESAKYVALNLIGKSGT